MVNTEENTVETTETTNTVDIEALQAQLKEQEEKNKILGDKIYNLKKQNKKTAEDTPSAGLSRDELEKFYQEKKFFEDKPEMSDYKDKLNEFTSKGLTYEQAEKLVIDANPDIVARQNTQNTNFTAGTPDFTMQKISKADLEKAEGAEYDKLRDLIDSGKSTLIQ